MNMNKLIEAIKEGSFKGFAFNGVFIEDPFLDETGRFQVNPFEYYGKHNIYKGL